MSYYTRQKQAYLPISLLESKAEPTPKTSGNAAVGYVSFQDRERFVWGTPQQKINRRRAFLAADGEEPVASDGVGFGTH